jgi:hypothetical protein
MPWILTVLGHQVVQKAGAKGLLLRTRELGVVVFSLPEAILQKLIADLAHLASSPAISRSAFTNVVPDKLGKRKTSSS